MKNLRLPKTEWTTPLAVLLLGLLVGQSHAGAAEPDTEADPLVGTWHGVHTGPGDYMHEIRIVKRYRSYVAQDLTYSRMSLETAQALSKGRRLRPKLERESPAPFAVIQQHQVTKEGDKWRFRPVGGRKLHGSLAYNADSYLCTLDPDGYLYGVAGDAKGENGMVMLRRVDPPADNKPSDLDTDRKGKVTCWTNPKYHFQVRLPKDFDPDKPTPVIIYFSPSGGGRPPVPDVASELGWVSVGLTESRNGPALPSIENLEATLFHLHSRMDIHPRRLYFSGLSGGARASYMSCKYHIDGCGGVIGIVAGFSSPTIRTWGKPIYLITGQSDYNRNEMQSQYNHMLTGGLETAIAIHDGGHSAGPESHRKDAMRWMDNAWWSSDVPLLETDKPRLQEVAKALLAKAEDDAAPDRRQARYWLSRMAANRGKELEQELLDRIAALKSDEVYKDESAAELLWRRYAENAQQTGRPIPQATLQAIAKRHPDSTVAARVEAMKKP